MYDMNIGDYIAFKVTGSSGVTPTISDIGVSLATAQANEIPVTGVVAPNGYAYGLKVDKGLIIADRVVQHSISWDVLNSAKLIQGFILNVGNSHASSYTANYGPEKAFNGDITSSSSSAGFFSPTCPSTLQYKYQTAKITTSYSLMRLIYAGNHNNYPTSWTYEGSNDGYNWDVLDIRNNQTIADVGYSNYTFNNQTAYLYNRLNVSEQNVAVVGAYNKC